MKLFWKATCNLFIAGQTANSYFVRYEGRLSSVVLLFPLVEDLNASVMIIMVFVIKKIDLSGLIKVTLSRLQHQTSVLQKYLLGQ